MNAKEFERQWREDNHIQGSPYKLSRAETIDMMEAYRRAKVEKDIVLILQNFAKDHHIDPNGIKIRAWYNKLLNQ